ncbi:hypothetical protein Lalb_Chr22g0360081 [Lupinus albus]|uniref:Uncharacterized protein n=1 Tax=Lupinus albus TaxID=3870 RepID=A0A6A4NJ48_LUPAL|nr:hypothetical protein Lalb_Chr22g0360081 [Lupinus albus]
MADPISKTLILLYVFFILFFFSNSHASSDVPFIVAHKKANINKLKTGSETVSVTIDIYNQGSSYSPFSFSLQFLFFLFYFNGFSFSMSQIPIFHFLACS